MRSQLRNPRQDSTLPDRTWRQHQQEVWSGTFFARLVIEAVRQTLNP